MMRGGPSRYAAAAAQLIRSLRQEPSPSLPSDRRRLVSAVEQALAARGRRRRVVRRWGVGLVSAAAALAIAAGLRGPWTLAPQRTITGVVAGRALTILDQADRSGAGAFLAGGGPTALRRGMILPAGIRLVAPSDGEVQLGTAAGTVMTMEKAATLTVTEAAAIQRFALHTGAVRVHVAPVLSGERFVINTAEAEIEVFGTSFRVAVVPADADCAYPRRTRVSVSEGVVAVRSGTADVRLTPGSSWLSVCRATDRTAMAAPAARKGEQRSSRHGAGGRAAQGPSASGPAVAANEDQGAEAPAALPPSVLAAQNNLFAAALRARNDGRNQDAVALFGRLLTEFPRGPLTESASVQRMKALAIIDPAAAARAAAEYLRRFPAGFASSDARALLAHQPRDP